MIDNNHNIEFKHVSISQLGFVIFELPYSVIKSIKDEVDEMRNINFKNSERYNYSLAGAIEHEYVLTKSVNDFEQFITKIMPYYFDCWMDSENRNRKVVFNQLRPGTKDFWVNFQKKTEYNPLHHHGGIFSFVIWINIPYDRQQEINLPHIKQQNCNKTASSFIFRYPDFLSPGGINYYSLPIDKTYEGKIIIFPAWFQHEVTPFYTSDDYRISASGNLSFEE